MHYSKQASRNESRGKIQINQFMKL